jgi:hypothetical protein
MGLCLALYSFSIHSLSSPLLFSYTPFILTFILEFLTKGLYMIISLSVLKIKYCKLFTSSYCNDFTTSHTLLRLCNTYRSIYPYSFMLESANNISWLKTCFIEELEHSHMFKFMHWLWPILWYSDVSVVPTELYGM